MMGTYLLITAAMIEIAVAATSIATKSAQRKARSIVRIAELCVLGLMAALAVIDWGFRYYALFALFLMLAAMGAVRLIRHKDTAFKPKRIVLGALGTLALIFAAALPAVLFPEYRLIETSGAYKVADASYTYLDAGRQEGFSDSGESRTLNVGLWYPKDGSGKYPLIVYSHGGISVRTSNESLCHELASHGYVVCAIDHTYHSLWTTDQSGNTITIDKGYMQELRIENAREDRRQSYEYYQNWMDVRTDDIDFVIERVLAEAGNEQADAAYNLVDTSRIGVMGHSIGGSAALGIGRIRDDVGAVAALESPFMCDIVGVENGEFVFTDDDYPVPVLNVYSDSAWGHLAEWPQYAQNNRMLSGTDANAYTVCISGAGHYSLTDLALASPILTRLLNGFNTTADARDCLRTLNKVCVAFFDGFLKETGNTRRAGRITVVTYGTAAY